MAPTRAAQAVEEREHCVTQTTDGVNQSQHINEADRQLIKESAICHAEIARRKDCIGADKAAIQKMGTWLRIIEKRAMDRGIAL